MISFQQLANPYNEVETRLDVNILTQKMNAGYVVDQFGNVLLGQSINEIDKSRRKANGNPGKGC